MKVIDATDLILGRLASLVAKELLNGEEIVIVNAEECAITGSKESILQKYRERRERKSIVNPRRHGPHYPRRPDGILRRAIRGMLPYKKDKGRRAFKRLRVYVGTPKEFEGKAESIEEIKVFKLEIPKYMKLKELSKLLGAKF
ncbi:MAG: 50S ribosomal protein L13 [Candidatus Hydrothermarchaeota archaeon]|nr:MAG: 50S ribosomal protein L13 [Candidatus Hydrothermarchaeota archaeon]